MSPRETPLKILHIASGDRWGGAEAQLFTLLSHLHRNPALDVLAVLLNDHELAARLRERGIAVTVYFGQRKGSASTADLREASLDTTVEQACAIARHTEHDPAAGLADAALMARYRENRAARVLVLAGDIPMLRVGERGHEAGFSFAEIEGHMCKFMTVVKVRGTDHSNELREYRITDKGIEVDPHATDLDALMSGFPTRRTPHR